MPRHDCGHERARARRYNDTEASLLLLAELKARFPCGVLLVTDTASAEPIASWATPEDQVTAARTALVVCVRHGDEGETTVRIVNADGEARGALIFAGQIELPSGMVRLSDATGNVSADAKIHSGQHAVRIFADSTVEASAVDVVLEPSG